MYTTEQIKEMFIQESNIIWRNYPNDAKLIINYQDRESLMSIIAGHKDRRTKAIGNVLTWKPNKIILNITPRALDLSEDIFRAYLRHESLHLGYVNHDRNFSYMAHKNNTVVSEQEMENKPTVVLYQIQDFKGSRFRTIEKENFSSIKDFENSRQRVRKKLNELFNKYDRKKPMRIRLKEL